MEITYSDSILDMPQNVWDEKRFNELKPMSLQVTIIDVYNLKLVTLEHKSHTNYMLHNIQLYQKSQPSESIREQEGYPVLWQLPKQSRA